MFRRCVPLGVTTPRHQLHHHQKLGLASITKYPRLAAAYASASKAERASRSAFSPRMSAGNAGVHRNGLRIAVEGCGHGTLNAIYDSIQKACKENNCVVDLLIICGDFQAVRNLTDLEIMSCPPKYRQLADFHEYYSGSKVAPILTLFIGGNHESSSYLAELFHGGWVAPNMYYLGAASVVQVGNLRIGGLSGIYKSHDYNRAHTERLPYYPRDIKSIYHVRQYDVFKLFQISSQLDVMLSHDWPNKVEYHGDMNSLYKVKPHFRTESKEGTLGSPPADSLLKKLRPSYWFSAHMHVKFAALVDHEQAKPEAKTMAEHSSAVAQNPDELQVDLENDDEDMSKESAPNPDELQLDLEEDKEDTSKGSVPNPDELQLDLEEDNEDASKDSAPNTSNPDEVDLDLEPEPEPVKQQETALPAPVNKLPEQRNSKITNRYTRFLSLDKCLPGRDFLQIMTVDFPFPLARGQDRVALSYDPEWLAITRVFNEYPGSQPNSMDQLKRISPEDLQAKIDVQRLWVEENIVAKGKLTIPKNFKITAPPHRPGDKVEYQPAEYRNNQTQEFCELLGMENWVWQSEEDYKKRLENFKPPAYQQMDSGRGGWRGGRGSGNGRGGRGRGGRGRGDRGRSSWGRRG